MQKGPDNSLSCCLGPPAGEADIPRRRRSFSSEIRGIRKTTPYTTVAGCCRMVAPSNSRAPANNCTRVGKVHILRRYKPSKSKGSRSRPKNPTYQRMRPRMVRNTKRCVGCDAHGDRVLRQNQGRPKMMTRTRVRTSPITNLRIGELSAEDQDASKSPLATTLPAFQGEIKYISQFIHTSHLSVSSGRRDSSPNCPNRTQPGGPGRRLWWNGEPEVGPYVPKLVMEGPTTNRALDVVAYFSSVGPLVVL